jgi:hypothetical protein
MVLAGEGDLDRGVKEKISVIFPSPLKKKHFDVKSLKSATIIQYTIKGRFMSR